MDVQVKGRVVVSGDYADVISGLIREAEGRSYARLLTYDQLQDAVDRLDARLEGVPKKYKEGIVAYIDVNYMHHYSKTYLGIDELNKLNDGYKNCPIYIRPKWDDFKALVRSYRSKYKSLYYVQVGAFKKEDNARAFLETVKKAYPSAFVKENGLYYVQVGAFSDLNNANTYLQFVKQDYPSAFIKTF